ncbi:DUF952 domain-containing protein [Sphingomonas gilva]|uniref:DUF952 domain-containing protein n=1 Tax=Sphingomonas gilva TaxID=2305907 RepID=A0A396RJE4_9SPHN|nr:DUF952 domain-containing protein [Sphingomonas gilva]RHW16254.1 DUF952 domain-containing protein [Sphingomonas gilva]
MTERPTTAYKILTAAEMAALEADGSFAGSPDDRRDGYIHLSTAAQLDGTLARHFAGQTDLHLAAVDLAALADTVRWEPARDSEFPHIHGPLPLDAVIAYSPLERDEDGKVRLPVTG